MTDTKEIKVVDLEEKEDDEKIDINTWSVWKSLMNEFSKHETYQTELLKQIKMFNSTMYKQLYTLREEKMTEIKKSLSPKQRKQIDNKPFHEIDKNKYRDLLEHFDKSFIDTVMKLDKDSQEYIKTMINDLDKFLKGRNNQLLLSSPERLDAVVNKLYNNGNDNRSNKNGNPKTLIDKLSSSGSHIITCGLYTLLSSELRNYINDKDSRKSYDYIKLGKFATFVLQQCQNAYGGYYIKLTDKGKDMLDTLSRYDKSADKNGQRKNSILEDLPDDFRKAFKIECIIDIQERQKITPREAR
jgi:hypothetical protein